jgi:hypothetical protein
MGYARTGVGSAPGERESPLSVYTCSRLILAQNLGKEVREGC